MMRSMSVREVVSGGQAALPSLNTRVLVSPHDGAAGSGDPGGRRPAGAPGPIAAPSLVEDLRIEMTSRRPGPAEIVIAQPSFPGNLRGESVGAEYVLRWPTDRGVHEVVGRYLGRERIGASLIGWRLRVTGSVSRIQRRAHARVEVALPVELAVLDTTEADATTIGVAVFEGLTVNLSEGGVLANVRPTTPPSVGSAVVVRFELAHQKFVLSGKVVRAQPVPGRVGALGVAVQFDTPDAHGDRLRPLLFAHELNARRVGVC